MSDEELEVSPLKQGSYGLFYIPDLLEFSSDEEMADFYSTFCENQSEVPPKENETYARQAEGPTPRATFSDPPQALQAVAPQFQEITMASPSKVEEIPITQETQTIESTPRAIKRFKSISSERQMQLESANQSASTKKNTTWGIKIFQDWNQEVYGSDLDLMEVSENKLAEVLAKFYCEAKPKNTKRRVEKLKMPTHQAAEYHRNTLLNIRGAVNRRLVDIGRNIDIVRGVAFKRANRTLDGLLKERTRTGIARPTAYKDIIPPEHVRQISTYLQNGIFSPYILRQSVWYNLAVHFVTRGLEFHEQLRLDSFEFISDEHGHFVTLNHNTQQKHYQGGFSSSEAPTKRMYATDTTHCPVKMLKLLISKTDPTAEKLFNHYVKEAGPESPIWYTSKPLAKRTFLSFMVDICKGANIPKKYTAHCLRATSIQSMNDFGFEARHIMFLSGHKSESAIRSYNRSCSTTQRKTFSSALSAIANGDSRVDQQTVTGTCPTQLAIQKSTITAPAHLTLPHTVSNGDSLSVPRVGNEPSEWLVPVSSTGNVNQENVVLTQETSSTNMSSFTSAGFLSNSTFHGCTFNFKQ